MILFILACSLATIGCGVAAGANSMCHDTASKPGALAASAKVGTSGSCGSRVDDDTASARSLPSLNERQRRAGFGETHLHVAGDDVLDRLRRALVRHVRHV